MQVPGSQGVPQLHIDPHDQQYADFEIVSYCVFDNSAGLMQHKAATSVDPLGNNSFVNVEKPSYVMMAEEHTPMDNTEATVVSNNDQDSFHEPNSMNVQHDQIGLSYGNNSITGVVRRSSLLCVSIC